MSTNIGTRATLLCRYPIASSDMYYAEIGQRDIYAWDDPRRGFRIWGELTGGGAETSIPLCEVFLEYAMLCQSSGDETQAYYQMESFGTGLGKTIAIYILDNVLGNAISNPGACALECLLESLNLNFTLHQIGPELRFIICECPFEQTALRTGLPYSELTHVGINAMCQALLHVIQPELPIETPVDERVDHIFAINTENAYLAG
jgi:hypothetical protein